MDFYCAVGLALEAAPVAMERVWAEVSKRDAAAKLLIQELSAFLQADEGRNLMLLQAAVATTLIVGLLLWSVFRRARRTAAAAEPLDARERDELLLEMFRREAARYSEPDLRPEHSAEVLANLALDDFEDEAKPQQLLRAKSVGNNAFGEVTPVELPGALGFPSDSLTASPTESVCAVSGRTPSESSESLDERDGDDSAAAPAVAQLASPALPTSSAAASPAAASPASPASPAPPAAASPAAESVGLRSSDADAAAAARSPEQPRADLQKLAPAPAKPANPWNAFQRENADKGWSKARMSEEYRAPPKPKNPWNAFQKENAGKGWSRARMSEEYQAHKRRNGL